MRTTITVTIAITLALRIFSASAESSAPAAIGAKEPYSSGIAEIMTFTQIRHAKLWLAGNAGNWQLADYEIDELKEGLEDAAKYVPTYKDMPVGQMIGSTIMAPIAEVEQAIKARDRVQICQRDSTSSPRPATRAIRRPTGAFIVDPAPRADSDLPQSVVRSALGYDLLALIVLRLLW